MKSLLVLDKNLGQTDNAKNEEGPIAEWAIC